MDESKKRIKNNHLATNIRFLREKKNWTPYELAKKMDDIDAKNKYKLINRWEEGAAITQGYIDLLEKIFEIPHGTLTDPDLSHNYELFREYYDLRHAKAQTFKSGEEFLKWWDDEAKKAKKNPENYREMKIVYTSTFLQFFSFIKNLGYTDYDYKSVDFKNLYESTIDFIKRHHERNRPQQ